MAIMNVAYNRKTKVATLHPIGSAPPAGSQAVGTTGNTTTFYHAVQSLLRGIGVTQMGPVSIVFAEEIVPEVKPEPVKEEPAISPTAKKKTIF